MRANTGLTGKVAFAIAIDPMTGEVYVAQYLSLHQDSATTTPNDLVSLAANAHRGDGDADRRRRRPGCDNGDRHRHPDQLPRRRPDGADGDGERGDGGGDETPGCRPRAGRPTFWARRAITFNGAATTVAGLFANVANKGTDPDVPAASLDNGALSFAVERARAHRVGDGRRLWRGRSGHGSELCADGDQCGVRADPDRRHGDHAVAGRLRADHWYGWRRCGQSRA